MVVSLGLAAMRTRRGYCYPNAETSPTSSNATRQQQKQQRKVGENGRTKPGACPCGGGRKRSACCLWRGGEEQQAGGGGSGRKRLRGKAPERGVFPSGMAEAGTDHGAVAAGGQDLFEALPDDIVICVLCRLSATASAPADFVNVMLTCKRLKGLLVNPLVLSKASARSLAIRAKNWSDPAYRFLKTCVDAGNLEACYILGMIRFYCLQNRGGGASLMAKAAIGSHAPALYSLAVIQFNGSGGSKNDKDLPAGVALCARAAFLGHVDALRELGHCLQDGYGVRQNVAEGRRFLVQANARELASVLSSAATPPPPASDAGGDPPPWVTVWHQHTHHHRHAPGAGCPLLSDFGCNVPALEPHPANRFLAEWFGGGGGGGGCAPAEDPAVPGPGLRLCSHVGCGRPETRRHEFRRCSVCGAVNYCSRACQALDWKLRHKHQCAPMERWLQPNGEGFAPGAFRDAPAPPPPPPNGPPLD